MSNIQDYFDEMAKWHGKVVTRKDGEIVLCGKEDRPIGVFMMETTIKGFTLYGERFEFHIPEGVRTYGEASVKTSKTKEE